MNLLTAIPVYNEERHLEGVLREVRLESATLEEFFVQVTASQAMATESKEGGEQ